MARRVLPQRRPVETVEIFWAGHAIAVSVGFDPAAVTVAEVFADTGRGGGMQATVADACVLISLALQHGCAPAALGRSLGREPAWINGVAGSAPASPVGAIAEVVAGVAARIDAEAGR